MTDRNHSPSALACRDRVESTGPGRRCGFLRKGLAALALGSVVLVAACGGDGDDDSRSGTGSGNGSETGAGSGLDSTEDNRDTATTRGGESDTTGSAGGAVSPQEFCDAYFSIGIDPVADPVAFGEEAAELTPPAEIAEDWESLVEGDTAAAQDVTMWMIANCPQMNG